MLSNLPPAMQTTSKKSASFVLRHSIVPYRTLGAFFLAILVWACVVSYRSGKWGTCESAALLSGIYILYILMGLWYQVGVRDGVIWQRSFGRRRVMLPLNDIKAVRREISDTRTLVAMNKPFDRIAIHGAIGGNTVDVDVSTKHFVAADIRRLMRLIHEARPNLALPKDWLDPAV